MARVLKTIGGYAPGDTILLAQPTPAQLLSAIGSVRDALRRDAAAGRRSVVLFYYSGHARAKALNLGTEELALSTLRQRLVDLPAALRVVVLDACQSGAFSNIKGTSAAADFSFNSVRSLNATGVAVMASSAASELSQESEELSGSYFTHHLLVALRGAGDTNRDGRVSIHEAYTYAYNRTLIATAKTAVGKQHVTLETDLEGRGEAALTYPTRARAKLVLPATLKADILIYRSGSKTVEAEVHKAPGKVTLALAAKRYRVILRQGATAQECRIDLTSNDERILHPPGCQPIALQQNASKGEALMTERLGIEFASGFGGYRGDSYTDTLNDFGYAEGWSEFQPRLNVSVSYRLGPHYAAVGNVSLLEYRDYEREGDTFTQDFTWTTWGVSGGLRTVYPLGWTREVLVPFAEIRAGLTLAHTSLRIHGMERDNENHLGYQLAAAAGAHLMVFRHVGVSLKMSAVFAPTVGNRIDATHDSGGVFTSVGLRTAF